LRYRAQRSVGLHHLFVVREWCLRCGVPLFCTSQMCDALGENWHHSLRERKQDLSCSRGRREEGIHRGRERYGPYHRPGATCQHRFSSSRSERKDGIGQHTLKAGAARCHGAVWPLSRPLRRLLGGGGEGAPLFAIERVQGICRPKRVTIPCRPAGSRWRNTCRICIRAAFTGKLMLYLQEGPCILAAPSFIGHL
jgi:hypothetical protein